MQDLLQFIAAHWVLCLAFVVLSVAALLIEREDVIKGSQQVSPQQGTNLVNREGGIFIDVRDKATYTQGHIAGARHIPADELNAATKKLKKFKDTPIIVADQDGKSGPRLAAQLRRQGFVRVYALQGGVDAWRAEQLPLAQAQGA